MYPEIIGRSQKLSQELEYIRSVIAMSSEYTRDILQKEQDAIRESQRQLAAQQERLAREQEQFMREQRRAQYELQMAHLDLAIQQIAFKKECAKELNELKSRRKEIALLIELN